MRTFLCKTCNQKFESEGIRVDWNDPMYGPCSKFIASCPCNGEECEEYRPLKLITEELATSESSCGTGGCSCRR